VNQEQKKRLSRTILGLMMGGAGIAHFTHQKVFAKLVPDYLDKYRTQINAGTGVLQVVSAVSFFVAPLRAVARWSTTALLVPSFPEAFNQVRHPERLSAVGLPPRLAPARIVALAGVLAWTWWATKPPEGQTQLRRTPLGRSSEILPSMHSGE